MTRNVIRKLTIALGAAAVVAAAALSPTAASAGGWHGHHGHHGHHGWKSSFSIGFYGPAYYATPDCYVVRRFVRTPYGKRWRSFTVCY